MYAWTTRESHLAGRHLHVDQEVGEQGVGVGVEQVPLRVTQAQQIGLQCGRAAVAEWAHEGRRQREPGRLSRLLRLHGTEGAGCHPLGRDLVGWHGSPVHKLGPGCLRALGHRLERVQGVVRGRPRVVGRERHRELGSERADVRQRPACDACQLRLGGCRARQAAIVDTADHVVKRLHRGGRWSSCPQAGQLDQEQRGEHPRQVQRGLAIFHRELAEVEAAVDRCVGEQPAKVAGDELQRAHEHRDLVEELDGEELVGEVRHRDGSARPRERGVGEHGQESKAAAREVQLLEDQSAHVVGQWGAAGGVGVGGDRGDRSPVDVSAGRGHGCTGRCRRSGGALLPAYDGPGRVAATGHRGHQEESRSRWPP